jgi:hypothetical protein
LDTETNILKLWYAGELTYKDLPKKWQEILYNQRFVNKNGDITHLGKEFIIGMKAKPDPNFINNVKP